MVALCGPAPLKFPQQAWLLLLVIATLAGSPRLVAAAAPVSPGAFDAQLAAGEFSAALAAAQQVPAGARRDAYLARLAEAQARAGAADAAFHTLAHVSEDRSRSEAITATRRALPASAGGGAQADFDSLIDLITTTVRPQSWDEVGGPGSVSPFQNGVYVDAHGVLRRVVAPQQAKGLAVARLTAIRAQERGNPGGADPRLYSPLRKISLTRLEKHVQLTLAAGRMPDEEMQNLAGLEKIEYVLVYPDSGDLVLAGPAGSWHTDEEGRQVSRHTGRPVVQLDDLVVLLRYLHGTPGAAFACSINPTQEGLARTRKFAKESSATPLRRGERSGFLKQLERCMGRQNITVEGIDPRTRVARVMVEADYRMKLVGMGLEDGTVDVPSYLDLVRVKPGEAPPPLDVLRWWFTLKYSAVVATPQGHAFEIRGPGVQVLSENELLTKLGRRVHTGKSQPTNQEFANRFTRHFADLAEKYPVYADLQNIFDLALVCALIQSEGLAEQVGWHLTCFGDPDQYQVDLGPAPQSVDTVINHRLIGGKHLIVGVSGGVRVEPWELVQPTAMTREGNGELTTMHDSSGADRELPIGAWWWD